MSQKWRSLAPYLLCLAVLLSYLPSLPGGMLNWDDPWLIRDNPLLADASPVTLRRIWTDFSRETRLALGAEYLPVRDTQLWLEARVFGLAPFSLRLSALALYLAAVLLTRRALHRCLPGFVAAELAAWFFALHPVHVESVAWLAGRKDVLGLLFVGAAMAVHAGSSPSRPWLVPLCLLGAHLSKSMTVSALGLLAVVDLLARRKPDLRIYGASAVAAAGAFALHSAVGGLVGMTAAPAGGSQLTQALTMGPVLFRYLGLVLFPPWLSIVQDVPVVTEPGLVTFAALALVFVWGALGVELWRRRGAPLALASWLAFFAPLVPVSQVLFPLQNQMADRYLFLSLLAPALLFGALFAKIERPHFVLAPLALLGLGLATAERSWVFSSSRRVFADALAKTELSAMAPYQLAIALEEARDPEGALGQYETALQRSRGKEELGRRATNNIAKLRVSSGDLGGAAEVLLRGRTRWPDDPKMLANLVRVLSRLGRHAEARAAFEELVRRFPEEARGGSPAL